MDADARMACDAKADGKGVWAWRPSGRCQAGESDFVDDGDTKAGLTGASTQEPVNTIAQGMSVFRLRLR
jgi:hypothetical protein